MSVHISVDVAAEDTAVRSGNQPFRAATHHRRLSHRCIGLSLALFFLASLALCWPAITRVYESTGKGHKDETAEGGTTASSVDSGADESLADDDVAVIDVRENAPDSDDDVPLGPRHVADEDEEAVPRALPPEGRDAEQHRGAPRAHTRHYSHGMLQRVVETLMVLYRKRNSGE